MHPPRIEPTPLSPPSSRIAILPSAVLLPVQYLLWGAYDSTVFLFGLPLSLLLAALIFFWPRDVKLKRWRKRLAALLAVRYQLAPGGLALLLENDDHMAVYLQRFLAQKAGPQVRVTGREHPKSSQS